MAFSKFRPLDEESLVGYIKATPSFSSEIGHNYDGTSTEEVGDGNLSFLYTGDSNFGFFRRQTESCSMTKERSEHGGLWPEHVPPPCPIGLQHSKPPRTILGKGLMMAEADTLFCSSLLYRSTTDHQRAGKSSVLLLELANTLLNKRRELSICDVISVVG